MINIWINNKKYRVRFGQTIIQIADFFGIYIPRFCYHKGLSVASNCRMCLIEVKNFKKPLPACVTIPKDGMEIYTNSVKTLLSQKKNNGVSTN
jgi:NADH-quinone oxidoreductase subunit G